MLQIITIRNGELRLNGTTYTLTNPDNTPVPTHFSIVTNGIIDGDKLRIEVGQNVIDFIIGSTPPDILAYYAGQCYAAGQKQRARKPAIPAGYDSTCAFMFLRGWADAWKERGKTVKV